MLGNFIYFFDLAFGFCIGFLARHGDNVVVVRSALAAIFSMWPLTLQDSQPRRQPKVPC